MFAEYLARDCFKGAVVFESAGISPQTAADAENAIYTLKRNYNIDASNHVPRDVRSLNLAEYELIIALEKRVAEQLVRELGASANKVKVWKTSDPWGGDLAEYDACSLEIKKRVVQLRMSGEARSFGSNE